jgi:hypothetical protein
VFAYGRIAGANPLESLAPRRSDVRLYADAFREWARRLRPAQAAEGEA